MGEYNTHVHQTRSQLGPLKTKLPHPSPHNYVCHYWIAQSVNGMRSLPHNSTGDRQWGLDLSDFHAHLA